MITSSSVMKLPTSLRTRLSDIHLGAVQSIHREVMYPFSLLIFLTSTIVCLGIALLWNSLSGWLYIVFAVLLVGCWAMWLGRYNQIVICSDGFFSIFGKQLSIAQWDEIEQVQIAYADWVQSSDMKYYTIVRLDGTLFTIKVGPIIWRRDKALRTDIEREVTQRLLPVATRQFEQEGIVAFGELRIEREGVRGWFKAEPGQERIKEIPWSEIKDIRMRKQDIILFKTDLRREYLPYTATTPNLFVFTALVKHILNSHPG